MAINILRSGEIAIVIDYRVDSAAMIEQTTIVVNSIMEKVEWQSVTLQHDYLGDISCPLPQKTKLSLYNSGVITVTLQDADDDADVDDDPTQLGGAAADSAVYLTVHGLTVQVMVSALGVTTVYSGKVVS